MKKYGKYLSELVAYARKAVIKCCVKLRGNKRSRLYELTQKYTFIFDSNLFHLKFLTSCKNIDSVRFHGN